MITNNLQDELAEAIEAADPEPYDAGAWEAVRYYREISAGLLSSSLIRRIQAQAWDEGWMERSLYDGRSSPSNPYES